MNNSRYKTHMAKRFLLSLVYPERCGFCGEIIDYKTYYCEKCVGKLNKLDNEVSLNLPYVKIACVCCYDDISKQIIRLAKEENNGYALNCIGKLIYEKLISDNLLQNVQMIIPVPLHKKDKRKRGYNQSELIAAEISGLSGIKLEKRMIIKHKRTLPQKNLNYKERCENLKDSLVAKNVNNVFGKRILVIDDVITTGSTLENICKTLHEMGAGEIICGAFAKTVYKH